MRQFRFYASQSMAKETIITADRSLSNHLQRVLRLQSGDTVQLFNGDGHDYESEIIATGKQLKLRVSNVKKNSLESPLYSHLGQAICRADRMDYSLQKAVELGVSELTPLITARVQHRLQGSRLEKKMQHWQGVMISACEQSGRAVLPRLNQVVRLEDWLLQESLPTLILDPYANSSPEQVLTQWQARGVSKLRLVVGPEGGLTSDETAFTSDEITRIHMGPRIMRTETAGTAILTLLQHYLGDL